MFQARIATVNAAVRCGRDGGLVALIGLNLAADIRELLSRLCCPMRPDSQMRAYVCKSTELVVDILR